MSLSPIVLFTYNRPVHTKKVLDALALNKEAKESILYIYCDGAKSNATSSDLEKIENVKKIILTEYRFKEVIVNILPLNKGLANSIIDGVTEIVNRYGKIIVLEDDIIPSRFFLQFMNEALLIYENEEKVISIGAFNFFATDSFVPNTFFIPIPDCWGWATWKDRWVLFESDGEKLYSELQNNGLINKFNLNGAFNFEQMLIDQINSKNNSWAIRWQAVAYLYEKVTLYPKHSVTKNIGFDNEGTHGGIDNFSIHIKFAKRKITVKKKSVVLEERIVKKMEQGYKNSVQISFNRSIKPKFKKFLKYLLPSIIVLFINRIKGKNLKIKHTEIWSGNFLTWKDALVQSEGYDALQILDKVKKSVLKVKKKEVAYERDSVVFDKIQYSWPLLACLLKIAIENNNELNIVDFGGSLGSSYFQNKDFLKGLKKICWNVIEQSHFVSIGKNEIAEEQLHFYNSIDEIISKDKQCVLILSSVLQYLENPYQWIEKFIKYNFEYIIIERTAFIDCPKERITIQNVPESIYKASYPAWFFNENTFLNSLSNHYTLITDFDSGFTSPTILEDGIKVSWKGFILKLK